jgi:hypothetical protein
MNKISIPESLFPVSATAGARTTNGGVTFDAISMKNAQMVYLYIHFNQAVGHATAITPLVGTVVATTATALPNVVEIWYGNTTTAVTTLAKQTAAKLFTMDVGVTGTVHLIFKIDPSACGAYDCIGGTIANSAQATNFASATWFIQPRYSSKVGSLSTSMYIVD